MNHPFCPHCGADLTRDQPILINDFSMLGMGYPLCYRDRPLGLTRSETEICWTLMKAYPGIVRTDVILNRIGSDAESNTIAALICRVRAKFKSWGIYCPIANHRGYGYHWDPLGGCDPPG